MYWAKFGTTKAKKPPAPKQNKSAGFWQPNSQPAVSTILTPVLDLDWGQCAVIGNRSFHRDANIVTQLALALQKGLNKGGMKSCGKHFPGHGFVEGDSHHVLPCDERSREELEAADLIPFRALSQAGMAAVMPAHVVYPQIDSQPAGFLRKNG